MDATEGDELQVELVPPRHLTPEQQQTMRELKEREKDLMRQIAEIDRREQRKLQRRERCCAARCKKSLHDDE